MSTRHSEQAVQLLGTDARWYGTTRSFARTLRAAGVECTSVGIGSTPTLLRIDDATQPDSTIAYGLVNELHPGNYVFFDLMQYHLGSCTLEDCAGRVLATVVRLVARESDAHSLNAAVLVGLRSPTTRLATIS